MCPAGYYCPTSSGPLSICPQGAYCPAGSSARISCPIGTYSNLMQQTNISGCKTCTICAVGMTQMASCTSTTNRVCAMCNGAPQYATYYASSTTCSWTCNNGYAGSTCTQCTPNYWCASGISNRCPLYSSSIAGAPSQNDCTCNPGYMSQGTMAGTSPCVLCTSGSICPGGGVVQVSVTSTPQTSVAAQLMLVQQPLPVANNLVSLILGIPASLATMTATLPTSTAFTRQICRGSYCVSCDGTATCVPIVWVGIGQGSKYTFNVTSVNADTLVYFVLKNTGFCTPNIGLPSEYVTGTTVFISSISTITSIPLTCPTVSTLSASLTVTGTTPALARRRRLLEAGRNLLQTIVTNDALSISLVVPANLTNVTQAAVAASNLTVQGYSPLTPPGRQIVYVNASTNLTYATNMSSVILSCPENSTSPPGSVSLAQCVCLPGYRGNAASGLACAPCNPGVFCSGGLIGLCPPNATAPPMSNSSASCVCKPGFYGTTNCTVCPSNSYCVGGKIYPCTANAVSSVQSIGPESCYCKAGYNGTGNALCQPCSPGFWCWTGIPNACPMNWTSNGNAARVEDCFCMDGYESVSTRDSGGNAINVCLACSNSMYCKVRASPKLIYNTHVISTLHDA